MYLVEQTHCCDLLRFSPVDSEICGGGQATYKWGLSAGGAAGVPAAPRPALEILQVCNIYLYYIYIYTQKSVLHTYEILKCGRVRRGDLRPGLYAAAGALLRRQRRLPACSHGVDSVLEGQVPAPVIGAGRAKPDAPAR